MAFRGMCLRSLCTPSLCGLITIAAVTVRGLWYRTESLNGQSVSIRTIDAVATLPSVLFCTCMHAEKCSVMKD